MKLKIEELTHPSDYCILVEERMGKTAGKNWSPSFLRLLFLVPCLGAHLANLLS